jgi:FkbM family methyltransferase
MSESTREYHRKVLDSIGGSWPSFEPILAVLYRAVLTSGSVAVDGGANIGLHALQMAQAVDSTGMVMAVEPIPELLVRLRQRQREHGIPDQRIQCFCCGLSSAPGTADFFQVLDPVQHELSGLRKRRCLGNRPIRQIQVTLTTLDLICDELSRLDFIKLDLEGAEMDALRGGRKTIQRFRPIVSVEQDQESPTYFGYTWHEMFAYWESMGYRIYDLFGLSYSTADEFDQCAVWDFVAIPGERDPAPLFAIIREQMSKDMPGLARL